MPSGIEGAYKDFDLHRSGGLWPPTTPTLTGPEAVAACKKLWRKHAGRQWPGTWRIGRGNHRIYPRGTVMLANPGLGWPRLVHDLSHALYDVMVRMPRHSTEGPRLYVKGKWHRLLSKAAYDEYKTAKMGDHTDAHAMLEKQMVQMVIESGWLNGVLRKPDIVPVTEKTEKPEAREIQASKPDIVPVMKPKPSRRERNEAKVDAGIVRWTVKLKKAQKAVTNAEKKLKELAGKKRYYDRQRSA